MYNIIFICVNIKLFVILGSINVKMDDHQRTLSSYNVTNGSTLMLIIMERFVLYVIGLDLTQHEVEVPSCDPEVIDT